MAADTDRAAQHDIAEVLVRYTTGIDRRDWDLFRTCFTEDCRADYGDIGSWQGVDGLADYMVATHAGMGHTLHRLSNIAVTVDGDEADARSYVDAVIMAPDGRPGSTPWGSTTTASAAPATAGGSPSAASRWSTSARWLNVCLVNKGGSCGDVS